MRDDASTTKRRLLAIDDHPDSSELVVRVATKAGYEARAMVNPDTLKQEILDWQPDVVTLDLCMPDRDGVETLAILQEGGFAGHLVIISGHESWLREAAITLATVRGLKVAEHLPKPLDIVAFRELLARLQKQPQTLAPASRSF